MNQDQILLEHPSYVDLQPDYDLMVDSYKGDRHIKAKRTTYLPALPSHILDGMVTPNDVGYQNYQAYLDRAKYPGYVRVGVETLIGILNAQESKITLPAKMEYLRKNSSVSGESIDSLLRRIHEQLLVTGRAGLLGDLPAQPDPVNPQPYLALYAGPTVINWDDGQYQGILSKVNMVILNETGNKREGMRWIEQKKFRVLQLGAFVPNEPKGTYAFGEFEGDANSYDESQMVVAKLRGRTLDEIPFAFFNAKDNLAEPDIPPLLDLANECLHIYRSEADYRHALYMQGQDTLVVVGGVQGKGTDEAIRTGAGSRIDVMSGGDAKYIGTSSNGLPEMRMALENDRSAASVRTGQLLAPGKMSLESGEALKTRVAAQTATLTSVSLSAAAGLERVLKILAKWMGLNPDDVSVIPNLDFTNVAIEGQDIVQLITAKNLGYPLSFETLHEIAYSRGLTTNTFEQEMEKINADPQLLIKRATEMAMNLKGNNPLEAAGGPTKAPANNKSGASNKQT